LIGLDQDFQFQSFDERPLPIADLKAAGISAKVRKSWLGFGVSKVDSCHKLPLLSGADIRCAVLQSYPTDLGDASAVKATISAVQQDLGPISVLFWNPYSTPAPLLTATPEQVQSAYNVTVTGEASHCQQQPDSISAPTSGAAAASLGAIKA
jgi:NAD(P)-dependent dehydrogenase (short-subunit alcohol dehydrogenase family)